MIVRTMRMLTSPMCPKLMCFYSYSKNEYAEVVRVLQVVEDLIEAYIKVLQVCYPTWEPSFLIS